MIRLAALLEALEAGAAPAAALEGYLRAVPGGDAACAIALLSGRRPRRVLPLAALRAAACAAAGIPDWLFEDSLAAAGSVAEAIANLLPWPDPPAGLPQAGMAELLPRLHPASPPPRGMLPQPSPGGPPPSGMLPGPAPSGPLLAELPRQLPLPALSGGQPRAGMPEGLPWPIPDGPPLAEVLQQLPLPVLPGGPPRERMPEALPGPVPGGPQPAGMLDPLPRPSPPGSQPSAEVPGPLPAPVQPDGPLGAEMPDRLPSPAPPDGQPPAGMHILVPDQPDGISLAGLLDRLAGADAAGVLALLAPLPPAARLPVIRLATGTFRTTLPVPVIAQALTGAMGGDAAAATLRLTEGGWDPATGLAALLEPPASLARPRPFAGLRPFAAAGASAGDPSPGASASDQGSAWPELGAAGERTGRTGGPGSGAAASDHQAAGPEPGDAGAPARCTEGPGPRAIEPRPRTGDGGSQSAAVPHWAGDPGRWAAFLRPAGPRLQLVRRAGAGQIWAADGRLMTPELPEAAALLPLLPGGTVIEAVQAGPGTLAALDLLEWQGREPAAGFAARRALLAPLCAGPLGLALPVPAGDWRALAQARGTHGLWLRRLDAAPGDPWLDWPPAPRETEALLVHAELAPGGRGIAALTFALRKGNALVPVARTAEGLDADQAAELTAWIRSHATARFGPVRELPPLRLYRLSYEAADPAPRRKAGLWLRNPRILCHLPDHSPDRAATLDSLRSREA